MLRLNESIGDYAGPEVDVLIKLLGLLAEDRSQFVEEARKCVLGNAKRASDMRALIGAGLFDNDVFLNLLTQFSENHTVNMAVASHLLRQLIAWSIVHEIDFGANTLFKYRWNEPRLRSVIDQDALDNILLGPSYVVRKYAPIIPAVLVVTDAGAGIGTGFLLRFGAKAYLVTARHNVDPDRGVQFDRLLFEPDRRHDFIGDWRLSGQDDLAAREIAVTGSVRPLYLQLSIPVLSTTITLGYPKMATSDKPYLLAHRGELNAVVRSYLDNRELLIISNAVAPGSSGSPVLSEAGLVVGVVTDGFEANYADGRAAVKAATPASQIAHFLNSLSFADAARS
jgi:hypothetical protein